MLRASLAPGGHELGDLQRWRHHVLQQPQGDLKTYFKRILNVSI